MNKLFVFLGKSSSGKDAIVKELLKIIEKENLNINLLKSNTTRQMRKGEKEGVEYHFSTMHEFNKLYKRNEIVEYATYKIEATNEVWIYYTSKKDLKELDKSHCIKIVNPIGYVQLNQSLKNQMVTFLIDAPKEIRKERYIKRGSTDNWNERSKRDDKDFMYFNANYTINNDGSRTVNEVAQQILDIIKKEVR